MLSSGVRSSVCSAKKPCDTGKPGAWDWGLLNTGLYSLKGKQGQLDSGFQAGKEHPGEKKLKKAAWIYRKSKSLRIGLFGSSVSKAERQICVPHY